MVNQSRAILLSPFSLFLSSLHRIIVYIYIRGDMGRWDTCCTRERSARVNFPSKYFEYFRRLVAFINRNETVLHLHVHSHLPLFFHDRNFSPNSKQRFSVFQEEFPILCDHFERYYCLLFAFQLIRKSKLLNLLKQ